MIIQEIERALIKRYRSRVFVPFVKAINDFEMINDGDVIGICMSGGKDSFVLAKLFQELKRHGKKKFDIKFLVMNPGFNKENMDRLIENSKALDIPIIVKKSNIFEIAEKVSDGQPCYMCARMRRGFLYEFAKEQGCNKIALGHHFNDVIETILLNVLYAGNFKTMMPKIKATNFKNMELIRPMVYIREKDIKLFIEYTGIHPMNCGCKIANGELPSKRREVKQLISNLKNDFKDIDKNIFKSAENVNLDCIIKWKYQDEEFNFLDNYQKKKE